MCRDVFVLAVALAVALGHGGCVVDADPQTDGGGAGGAGGAGGSGGAGGPGGSGGAGGLDTQRPSYTKLLVPGVCPVPGTGLAQIDVSVLMLDGTDALPEVDVGPGAFEFTLPEGEFEGPENAFAEDGEGTRGVRLTPESLSWLGTGGAERARDDLLIVFALDHSGSMIGLDPRDGSVDLQVGSDPRDERIVFFTQAVDAFPEGAFMSVVSFSGDFVNVVEACAPPTLNRDLTRTCFTDLQRGEDGFTPLADALDFSLRRIITANEDLNPVIVLFTDGTEGQGDTSVKSLAEVQGDLVEANVPVIVIHLQPRNPDYPEEVRGRSAEYQALACATGGEYLFVERAEQLSDERTSNLQTIVTNRVRGIWRLRTGTTLGEAPARRYLLSTEVTATVDDRARSYSVTQARDAGEITDRRLFLRK